MTLFSKSMKTNYLNNVKIVKTWIKMIEIARIGLKIIKNVVNVEKTYRA